MNRLSETKFAIFISFTPLLKDLTNQNLCIFTAAGVVPCGGRKGLAHHFIADVTFWGRLFKTNEVVS